MIIVNNEEGVKPLSLKLKINYQQQGMAQQSAIKVVSNMPTNY